MTNPKIQSHVLGLALICGAAVAHAQPSMASARTPAPSRRDPSAPLAAHARMSAVSTPPAKAETKQDPVTQLNLVAHVFSLNRSELASAMSVSRAMIYNWLDGTNGLQPEKAARLAMLAQEADSVRQKISGPLNRLAVDRPLFKDGTLSFALMLPSLQAAGDLRAALGVVIQEHQKMMDNSPSAIFKRLGMAPPSTEDQEHNFEMNQSMFE